MTLEEAKNYKLSKHFTLYELIRSDAAQKNGIYNIPNIYTINELRRLCEYILEPIRQQIDKPIIVTSGYRSYKLNKFIGGAQNSCHVSGQAADIILYEGNKELMKLILKMVEEDKIDARTIIFEKCYNNNTDCRWIHIDINGKKHSYRHNKVIFN